MGQTGKGEYARDSQGQAGHERPRRAEWPGVVSVTWGLTYTSPSGDGALPDVVKSTPLPRAVDEVQTVVESAG